MATSKQLAAQRQKLKRAAKTIRKRLEAADLSVRDVAIRNKLEREAERLERYVAESKVGRKGTAEERSARINKAYNKLKQQEQSATIAKKQLTKKGLEIQRSKIERQERIMSLEMSMRAKQGRGSILDQVFWAKTHKIWRGAGSPEERYAMITEYFGTDSISEARDMIVQASKQVQYEIELLEARNWKKLKEIGFTDGEIAEAKHYDSMGKLYRYILNRYFS